ncbi:hypothetical protein AYX15_07033 [Cryptococcus neoformans]|nr:hypothetical protein AYX15_07033 [Cryptococcus neoformans var. grubii]
MSPLSPLSPLTTQISSLVASPVHPALFPLPRFAVLHAVRVALVWATLTKNTRRHKQHAGGRMQDLFGYLVMGWAGNTTVSILLALPPSWLVSPTPWLVYPLVYLLLIPTDISAWTVDHVPEVLVNTVGAAVDGLTRGVTIASIGTMVGASGKFPGPEVSAWTYTLLSALAVSSGGFVVSLFSLHEPSYRLSVPSVFRRGAGAWGTMDVWAAGLAGLGYWVMERLSVEDVKGVPGVGRLRGLAGGSEMGNGDEPLMDSLAARTIPKNCFWLIEMMILPLEMAILPLDDILQPGFDPMRPVPAGRAGEDVDGSRGEVDVVPFMFPADARKRHDTPSHHAAPDDAVGIPAQQIDVRGDTGAGGVEVDDCLAGEGLGE